MLVAGRQLLSLVELAKLPEGDLESPYQDAFEFRIVRNLQSKAKLSNTSVAFHPDNPGIAATASSNGAVCIWNVSSNKLSPLHCKWNAHSRSINALAFLPNERPSRFGILTTSADGALKHWIMNDPTPRGGALSIPSHQPKGRSDNNSVGADSDSGGKCYEEVADLRQERVQRTPIRDLHVQSKSSNSVDVLAAQEDGRVILYDMGLGNCMGQCTQKSSYYISARTIYSARFSGKDENIFCAASGDKHIRIFDIRSPNDGPAANIVTGSSVQCVRWRPYSSTVLASSASVMDHNLCVWDLRRLHLPVAVFNSHKKGDICTDFFWASPDHIVSSGKDSNIQLHALQNAYEPIRWAPLVSQSWCSSEVAVANQTTQRHISLAKTDPSTWYSLLGKFVGDAIVPTIDPSHASAYSSDEDEVEEEPGENLRRAYVLKMPWNKRSFASAAAERGFLGDKTMSLKEQCDSWAEWCGEHGFENQQLCWKLVSSLQGRITSTVEVPQTPGTSNQMARSIGAGIGVSITESAKRVANEWSTRWRDETVVNLVRSFEDINDVGMCLLLANVFNLASKDAELWEAKILDWSLALVDYLARSRQFRDRAHFIKNATMNEVRELSHCSFLNVSCSSCFSTFECKDTASRLKMMCAKTNCQKPKAVCSVCGEACSGLWAMCQICGHGGHIRHLHEWFLTNKHCPAGCSHVCHV